ncbi:hypothetical protein [Streptomyces humidus]|uniref:hypothetical protein n=1 Tax=Streptomyces humidus TaxID=52259 RepID=UPI003D9E7D7E
MLLVTGVLLVAAQRSTEPPVRWQARAGSPLRARMPARLAVRLAMGAVSGSMEVVTIAFADAQGHRSAAGVVLAFRAAGSCVAGLLFGALGPAGPADARPARWVVAMAAPLALPFLAASLTGSLALPAGALPISGTATAPTMVAAVTLVERRTPEGRLNGGMTLAVTGLLGGIACGSATGCRMVDHLSPAAGFGVPLTAAAVALMTALARRGLRNRNGNSRPVH